MIHLLASWWTAIWPNLVASVIWSTPAFIAHHVLVRRHIDRRHAQLAEHVTTQLGSPSPSEESTAS